MLKNVPIVNPPTGSVDGKGWQLLTENSKLLEQKRELILTFYLSP